MTYPYLALESASFILPDGRTLLSGLTENFDTRHTGLVGRNGVGKSVLARLLAGQLAPASGRCIRSGQVCYLSQQAGQAVTGTVASLAGVQAVFDRWHVSTPAASMPPTSNASANAGTCRPASSTPSSRPALATSTPPHRRRG